MKRSISLFLSVIMILSVFGGMTFTASAASSGTCGADGTAITFEPWEKSNSLPSAASYNYFVGA